MLSQQIETDKVYHQEAYKILFKKKFIVNLSKFFLGWSFFHGIRQDYFTFPGLQFIQAGLCYNL